MQMVRMGFSRSNIKTAGVLEAVLFKWSSVTVWSQNYAAAKMVVGKKAF